jgi:TctA family transporter
MKTVQFDEMTRAKMSRRELLRKTMGGSALGVAALAIPNLSSAHDAGPDSEQIAELYEFYAAVGL